MAKTKKAFHYWKALVHHIHAWFQLFIYIKLLEDRFYIMVDLPAADIAAHQLICCPTLEHGPVGAVINHRDRNRTFLHRCCITVVTHELRRIIECDYPAGITVIIAPCIGL